MILVDYNSAGVQVAAKAKAQGIPVIAYDRPISGADYYVSFDNEAVGGLEGQAILDGLKAAGKDPATAKVVYVGGDPKDGNAKMFHDGADAVMAAAGIKPVFETPGTWDGATAGTAFEQAYTSLGGDIDAVWVANDTNAAAVIAVLDKNGKTLPVSGQDASIAGLQNVLLGKQTTTVYKPFTLEAKAASDLAISLLKGAVPEGSAERLASIWSRYTFKDGGLAGLWVAGGGNYTSPKAMRTANPAAFFDEYYLVDAAVGYDWKRSNQSWNVALNIKNITDKVYYPANQSRGKPRQFILSVGTRF